MSYEKHEWVNNETITASKLNNIEDGIEEAAQSGGGGGIDAVVWFPNSTVGWQIRGDFASALQKAQNGIPLAILYSAAYNAYSYGFEANGVMMCASGWFDVSPNQIEIYFSTGVGLHWTANGVEFYD